MKLSQSVFLIANCAIMLAACTKKDLTSSPADQSRKSTEPFDVPITEKQYNILNAAMTKEKILNVADYRMLVESVRSMYPETKIDENIATSQARMMDDPSGLYDELFAAFSDAPRPGTVYGNAPVEGKLMRTFFEKYLTFPKRGNQIRVFVPYQYTWKVSPTNVNQIFDLKVDASYNVEAQPVGAYWGEVSQSYGTLNSAAGTDGLNRTAQVRFQGAMIEKRTQIFSTTGAAKISVEANPGVFKIGTELEAGFTIQSASNINNIYTTKGEGIIQISESIPGMPQYFTLPTTQYIGTATATQVGILRNS